MRLYFIHSKYWPFENIVFPIVTRVATRLISLDLEPIKQISGASDLFHIEPIFEKLSIEEYENFLELKNRRLVGVYRIRR